MTPDRAGRCEELEERFREGVISLIEKEQFWLKLVYDLRKADSRAESRMLGVIEGAAIGNYEVNEKKLIEDSIKRTVQITTFTKQLPPSKYCEKMVKFKTCRYPRQILPKILNFSKLLKMY